MSARNVTAGMGPTTHEPWMDSARCVETDPEAFFPEKGGTPAPAKSVCAQCEVAAQCLVYALAHGETFGVWGGLTAGERRALRRRTAA